MKRLLTEMGRKWKLTEMQQVPFPGIDGNFYGNGDVQPQREQYEKSTKQQEQHRRA